MGYAYLPGCSLHSMSRAYDESIRSIAPPLSLQLDEIEDWNCCGAAPYMNVDGFVSHCLSARNLALAESRGQDVVTPCSACYASLRRASRSLERSEELKSNVAAALAEAHLSYKGSVAVRHLLEVICALGLERIRETVTRPLEGLKVACYYGCQILRPHGFEGHPEEPVMLEGLIEALGASPVRFPMKSTCCGGALMGTREKVALRLCRNLMMCAQHFEADCLAVTCPLCHNNLEGYQAKVNRSYGTAFHMPVVFFPQLIGIALGLPKERLGLQRSLVPLNAALSARLR